MKDSVLILSGGVDSVTLLYDEQERIALAISFDYGSKHNKREIPFAQWHCKQLGIKHITIPLDFMTKYFVSSLLEGGEEIPEGQKESSARLYRPYPLYTPWSSQHGRLVLLVSPHVLR